MAFVPAAIEFAEGVFALIETSTAEAAAEAGASEFIAGKAGTLASGAARGVAIEKGTELSETTGKELFDYTFGQGSARNTVNNAKTAWQLYSSGKLTDFSSLGFGSGVRVVHPKEEPKVVPTQEACECKEKPIPVNPYHPPPAQKYYAHDVDPIQTKAPADDSVYKMGKELGKVVSQVSSDIAFVDEDEKKDKGYLLSLIEKLTNVNPLMNQEVIFNAAKRYQSKIPEFQAIYQKYTGDFKIEDVQETINEDGTKNFSVIDETGELIEWKGEWTKNYVSAPSLHGIFVGPNSRNNERMIDLLDLYSFAHDSNYYVNGFGHRRSDMIFLSRIEHNINKMSYVPKFVSYSLNVPERIAANIAIKYFSTGGVIMGMLLGNDDLTEKTTSLADSTSVFTEIVPPEYQTVEYMNDFKSGLQDGYREQSVTSSAISLGDTSNINPILRNDILSLEISLL